eukprot:TRINITY_DN18632_c0_g1_i1.p1 TRINITY_DN18632_c0_g1~~TRINITY_DN18632_c0_g1_i1.p1  ORF type:complete len:380 (-),score=76.17 TRINITY_DN18632_c0_g1_i1:266-1405(-)
MAPVVTQLRKALHLYKGKAVLVGAEEDASSTAKQADFPAYLEQTISKWCAVQLWQSERFEKVRQLEEAPMNRGRVDLMQDLENGSMVAVKRMPTKWLTSGPAEFSKMHSRSPERPWVDIGIVRHLNGLGYPFVSELKGVFDDGQHAYVVSTFAEDGDLLRWCNATQLDPGLEREALMLPLFAQVVSAVKWLHNLGIAHRDISLENILVTEGSRIRLIDFGMATFERECVGNRGKKAYEAPEMHSGAYDPFLTDAFAVGVLAYGMASRDYPWFSTRDEGCRRFRLFRSEGLRRFLSKQKVQSQGSGCRRLVDMLSDSVIELMDGLLNLEPNSRWTLGERCWEGDKMPRMSVWRSPWLADYSCASKMETRWRLRQSRTFGC